MLFVLCTAKMRPSVALVCLWRKPEPYKPLADSEPQGSRFTVKLCVSSLAKVDTWGESWSAAIVWMMWPIDVVWPCFLG